MKRIVLTIITLLILLLGVSFAAINSDTVTFNYYLNSISMPLSMLLVLSFALGAILGMLAGLGIYFRVKQQSLRYKREAKSANKELANLRAVPLIDEP